MSAVEQVFNADFAKTSITPSDGADLVWSPTDSQTRLLNLVNGAQHSLDVEEEEEFGDTALVNAVVADAQRGVSVRVVAENQSNSYATELGEVTAAGGQVNTYTSSTAYDTLTVQVLNSSGSVLATLATYSNLNHNTGYTQHSLDLSAYAGQSITLKFTGTEDSAQQTSFVVDDTSVNVS